jgi:hypothetical protein
MPLSPISKIEIFVQQPQFHGAFSHKQVAKRVGIFERRCPILPLAYFLSSARCNQWLTLISPLPTKASLFQVGQVVTLTY